MALREIQGTGNLPPLFLKLYASCVANFRALWVLELAKLGTRAAARPESALARGSGECSE